MTTCIQMLNISSTLKTGKRTLKPGEKNDQETFKKTSGFGDTIFT